MDRQQNLAGEIDKQIGMGFSIGKIKSNMIAKGYSGDEVQNYLNWKAANPTSKKRRPNYLQMLVSVLILTIGIMDVVNNKTGFRHTWGYVLIVIGSLGLILKLLPGGAVSKTKTP